VKTKPEAVHTHLLALDERVWRYDRRVRQARDVKELRIF
jgi:hypothetical protein